MKLYTQLNFGGNCEEALRFYEKHLGGKIEMIMRQNEAPGAPKNAGNAIIHARMNIGDTVLIANDVPPSVFKKMRSVYMYLSVDSRKRPSESTAFWQRVAKYSCRRKRRSTRLASACCATDSASHGP